MLTHLQAECQCPKTRPSWANTCGSGEVNISAFIRAPCTKLFWRFLRHIGTFLDYLGGVDTPMGRAPAPKTWAKLSRYMGEGEVSVSASIRAPCTKYFWRFLRQIGTFLNHLWGVDTPMSRVPAPKTWSKLSRYMGRERSISQLLLGPHTPNFVSRFLRHIGTFLRPLGGVDPPVGRVPVPKN